MCIYDVDDLPEHEWERVCELEGLTEPTIRQLAGQLWRAIVERVKRALGPGK